MKLKRFAAAALTFCLMLTLLPCTVLAATAAFGDGWSLSTDGVLTVTKDVEMDSGSQWSSRASSVTRVVIGRDVKDVSGNAFSACGNLASFAVEQGNTYFSAGTDGVLYNAEGTELVCYPAAHSDSYAGHSGLYMVPESVVTVWRYAFTGLVNSKKSLKLYAYEATRTAVAADAKSRVGDDFPTGMIYTYKPVTGVRLDSETLAVKVGKTETLKATVLPADATFPEVSWDSQAKDFAEVDSKGSVKGILAGTSMIVVTTADGEFTASCLVTVEKEDVNGLELTPPGPLTLSQGTSTELTARVTPYNATYKNISFLSTDRNVVEISSEGSVRVDGASGAVTFEAKADPAKTTASVPISITAVNPGTASIIATTADGGYYAVCEVTVPPKDIVSFKLDKTTLELTRAASGENREATGTLKATVEPEGATFGAVRWYSSDDHVVKVSWDGNTATLTTAGPGKAAVIAETADGRQQSCTVTVWDTPIGAELSLTKLTLAPGEEMELYSAIQPETARQDVTWSSDKSDIVEVNPLTGVVRAKNNGTAVITVQSNANPGIKKECIVTVRTSVTRLTLNKTTLELDESDKMSEQLIATVEPEKASEKGVTWISYNTAVATVNTDGVVTAVGPGTTKIVAVTNDGGETAACTVTVTATKVTGVTLDRGSVTLGRDGTAELAATVLPATAKNKNVTWKSSDPDVVDVQNGRLTAKATRGTAVITVTTAEGGFTAQCTVTVHVPVTDVTLQPALTVVLGSEAATALSLDAAVLPADATDTTVYWYSSDPTVATVDVGTGQITPKTVGTTAIIAVTKDGGKTAGCVLTVRNNVTEVKLDQTTLSLRVGDSASLIATVEPLATADQTVKWKSSDERVATVVNGRVTAVAKGTATITATSAVDEDEKAVCEVTVNDAVNSVTGISLGKDTLELDKGATAELTATIEPSGATDRKVFWTSTDPTVASVSLGSTEALNGTTQITVKGEKAGSSTIIVTTEDGGHMAWCTVTVKPVVDSVRLDTTEMTVGLDDQRFRTLTATVEPYYALNQQDFKFEVNDNSVIALVGSGNVRTVVPLTEGSAVVTASAGGKESEPCIVVVTTAPLNYASLSKNALDLTAGGASETLNVKVFKKGVEANLTDTTSYKTVWSSSSAAAAVDQNGQVKPDSEGTALVTATVTDIATGYVYTASCLVTVTPAPVPPAVPVTGISPGEENPFFTLSVRASKTLSPEVRPENATTDKSVTWYSSDPDVADVTGAGMVTANAPGTAVIVAVTKDGGFATPYTVTVTGTDADMVTAEPRLSLSEPELTFSTIGDDKTLTASFTSGGETKTVAAVWSSSDPGKASVDKDTGVVTSKGTGTATITAAYTRGDGKTFTASCEVTVYVPVTGLTLSPDATLELDLPAAKTQPLSWTVTPGNASRPEVTWHSSNGEVASVSDGTVTAVGTGTAVIVATTADGAVATCNVTVRNRISDITLNKRTLTLTAGETERLFVVSVNEGADPSVEWRSADSSIASVEKDTGVVTARATNVTASTTIYAESTTNPGVWGECEVTVKPRTTPVTGITLTPDKALTLKAPDGADTAGKTAVLTATITPNDATNQAVTWTSTNPDVADVSGSTTAASGVATATVTAKKPGKTTIIVTTADGRYTDSCTVTVDTQIKPVTSITLTPPKELTLKAPDGADTAGKTAALTATITPNDATNQAVTWTSTNPDVADVSGSTAAANGVATATVTAKKPGRTTIIVTTADGRYTDSCTVTVDTQIKPVTSITLTSPKELTLKAPDGADTAEKTAALTATITPNDATNQAVTWTSTNPDVADVSGSTAAANGVATATVTAKKPGRTTIIVTTADGRYTDSCTVTVDTQIKPVTGIALTPPKELTLKAEEGDTPAQFATLTATINPSDATNQTVTWMSTDPSIAKLSDEQVDEDGNPTATVTAVAPGKAMIIVTTADGNWSDMCTVTVPSPEVEIVLDQSDLTMYFGDTPKALTATVKPPNAAYGGLKWSSTDNAVATVTGTEIMTGLVAVPGTKTGRAVITAATADGRYTASCIVTVWKKTTSLDLRPSLMLAKGDSWPLKAVVSDGANPEAVTWVSSDDAVATVQDGVVKAEGAGTASIIATVSDAANGAPGQLKAICTVTVTDYKISSEIKSPTIAISGEGDTRTVTLSAENGDEIYYLKYKMEESEPTEYTKYDTSLTVDADSIIKAYAVRDDEYQSAVVTGIVNVTEASNRMVLTDKMGNAVESVAEVAADGAELSFTANITLSAEAREQASDIYLAVYDTDGYLIDLEKFEIAENDKIGEADSQVISKLLNFRKAEGTKIGSIKLMVLSKDKVPVMSAGDLSG